MNSAINSKVDKTTQEQKDASQDNRLTALEQYAITTPGEAGQVWMSDGTGAGKWEKVSTGGKMSIVRFTNYSGTIPVVAGCKYSTDGNTWTEVTKDGTVPTPFTGWVKFTTEVSGEGYTTRSEVFEPNVTLVDVTSSLSKTPDSYFTKTSWVKNNKHYMAYIYGTTVYFGCFDINGNFTNLQTLGVGNGWYGGATEVLQMGSKYYFLEGYSKRLYKIDENDVLTATQDATNYYVYGRPSAFVLNNVMYFYGGNYSSAFGFRLDANEVYTAGPTIARNQMNPIVIGDKAYLLGGNIDYSYSGGQSTKSVMIIDSNGNVSYGTALSYTCRNGNVCMFNGYGYLLGGDSGSSNNYNYIKNSTKVDVNGNYTTGPTLTGGGIGLCSGVLNGKMYVCGGYINTAKGNTVIDVIDTNDVITNPITLNIGRYDALAGVVGDTLQVAFGHYYDGSTVTHHTSVEIIEPKNKYTYTLKVPVTEFTEYKIDGVGAIATANTSISKTKTQKALSDPGLKWAYEFKYENGNIS